MNHPENDGVGENVIRWSLHMSGPAAFPLGSEQRESSALCDTHAYTWLP
jgi:hypothetical protein